MSEPQKPSHPQSGKPKKAAELPDDEAIRRLFPKTIVEQVNREIGHTPKTPKTPKK